MSLRLIFVEIELIFVQVCGIFDPENFNVLANATTWFSRAAFFLVLKLKFTHKKHYPGSIFFLGRSTYIEKLVTN